MNLLSILIKFKASRILLLISICILNFSCATHDDPQMNYLICIDLIITNFSNLQKRKSPKTSFKLSISQDQKNDYNEEDR